MGQTTDGLFTIHSKELAIKLNTPYKLIIFGDVHRDSPSCAEDRWREFLDYSRRQKAAFFLGMGDYHDSFSTSEREILSVAGIHDSTRQQWEEMAAAKCRAFAKEIGFMEGRLIGLIGGNHFGNFQDGTTTDQLICRLLRCQYLGVCAFVRLWFRSGGNHSTHFDLFLHHGKGASRLLGGSINRVDQLAEIADADCYIMGHDHRRGVIPASPKLRLEENRGCLCVKERRAHICRSGSFLKAYEPGQRSYVVDAARGPANLGHIELEITMRRERRGGADECGLEVRGIA